MRKKEELCWFAIDADDNARPRRLVRSKLLSYREKLQWEERKKEKWSSSSFQYLPCESLSAFLFNAEEST